MSFLLLGLLKNCFDTDNCLIFQLSKIPLCCRIIVSSLALDFIEWVYETLEILKIDVVYQKIT